MRIAADSAAFGEPVEVILEDRRLFCDAVSRYYLDYEPEHAWVAVVEPEVVVSCRLHGWARRAACLATRILPRLAWGLLRGRYRVGSRTWQQACNELAAVMRREFPPVDSARYPAHLHINVDAAWRGRGAGRSLMEAYLAQLRSMGVPGVYLRTTNLNVAAGALYTRLGFQLLGARPTRLWGQATDQPVENLCYGLRLN
jgi:ribosomal protein S18 acetylase RimI-like enzyme